MPEELLTIFKVCLLILLYLFFFRVLRAVWTEVNSIPTTAGGSAPAAKRRRGAGRAKGRAAAPAATVAAPPAGVPASAAATAAGSGIGRPTRAAAAPAAHSTGTGDAQPATTPTKLVAAEPSHIAGLHYALHPGMTLGRGSAASVVLDDSFLSQQHVAFEHRDADWFVVDLQSTNGTYLNGAKVERPARLRVGDRVQIGNIVLEAR